MWINCPGGHKKCRPDHPMRQINQLSSNEIPVLTCCPAQAYQVIVVIIEVCLWRFTGYVFKYPVKIGYTFKPAFIGYHIYAFEFMGDKLFTGFIYSYLI